MVRALAGDSTTTRLFSLLPRLERGAGLAFADLFLAAFLPFDERVPLLVFESVAIPRQRLPNARIVHAANLPDHPFQLHPREVAVNHGDGELGAASGLVGAGRLELR